MKVGDERVNHLELIAREDEEIRGLTITREELTALGIPRTLKAAYARCANSNNATAVSLRLENGIDGLLRNAVVFGMHAMFVGVLDIYDTKCIETYFKVYCFEADTLVLQSFDQLRREV